MKYVMGERDEPEASRVFLQDEELIAVIKDVAKQQSRAEEDVIAEFTKIGLSQFLTQSEMQDRWASLSHREQQVSTPSSISAAVRNCGLPSRIGISAIGGNITGTSRGVADSSPIYGSTTGLHLKSSLKSPSGGLLFNSTSRNLSRRVDGECISLQSTGS